MGARDRFVGTGPGESDSDYVTGQVATVSGVEPFLSKPCSDGRLVTM